MSFPFRLHQDNNFHYETLRSLGTVRYMGSDIAEQLYLMPKIKPNDFDSWYDAWAGLAKQVLSTIDESKLDQYNPVTIRNVFFRASHYYFNSEFFLHANWDDPRSLDAFDKWVKYFDIANAHLDIPGKFFEIDSSIGKIPGYFFRTPKASAENPRPTLLAFGGFDSNMEEMYHDFGIDWLERGYNVAIFEGPGQPRFLRQQHKGFIFDWEKVVTPVFDVISKYVEVDETKIGLLGMSLGGYLAARAAAFEPRLAAVMLCDGVMSFWDCCKKAMPEIVEPWEKQDEAAFNKIFGTQGLPTATSNQRWFHDHCKLSFQQKSAFELFKELVKMDLSSVASKIEMPCWIGDAEVDIFFKGQPQEVMAAVQKGTLTHFDDTNAAAAHCASGALVYQNQVIAEWFANVIGEYKQ